MENELLSIGRMASLSGLPVSALRFYDGAGVLPPSVVDPSSGYRFYGASQVLPARLVAHLRRVGLPLDEIRTIAADPTRARSILDAHLDRLEAGLADARSEISRVHHLLETTETTMHQFILPAADLVRALREIRYAVCEDPQHPRLHGVFLEGEPGVVRVVATDRYRLATSTVKASAPTELSLLLPTSAVDELISRDLNGSLEVTVSDGTITFAGVGGTVRAELPDVDFPTYRSWLELGRTRVPVDAVALRAALSEGATETQVRDEDGAAFEVSRLSVSTAGVTVGGSDDPDAVVVGVNREYLLQALDSGDQLTLGLDDPIAPLAIRHRDHDRGMSILMPVRLEQLA